MTSPAKVLRRKLSNMSTGSPIFCSWPAALPTKKAVPTSFGFQGKIGDRMVMPLYDDNPFRLPHRPVVTWSLILANVLVFLAEIGATGDPQAMFYHFGLTPAALSGDARIPGGLPPSLTLLSYMFLHADVVHLLGN